MAKIDVETQQELETLVGKQATAAVKAQMEVAEKDISKKFEDLQNGLMTQKAFDEYKAEKLDPINATLKTIQDAVKEQGRIINDELIPKAAPNSKSLDTFLIEMLDPKNGTLKNLRNESKPVIFSSAQLKAAGVQSVTGTIPTPSPYAPGVGGEITSIFDIARDPNFILNRVNLGRTEQSLLVWANELETIEGTIDIDIAEGGLKPQMQHKFEVETSKAKKAAGWVELTEELEQDLPQFATRVRRMLQEDVIRAFDNGIQAAVIAAARPYEITDLDGKIPLATFWDALYCMFAQVGKYNFQPNTAALNWITNVLLKAGDKATTGEYLIPSFLQEVQNKLIYANKVAVQNALVGDLSQFNVDIYKDFYMKVGWINDELIHNKYAVVGEMRYHAYISNARKKALVYDDLGTVKEAIAAA